MSWHYSQALEAAYSAATCSAGAASAPSSETPTHGTFWSPDRTMAASRRSRSGMTYAPSTDDHGEALLTWFLAASRVKTSALRERAQASTASDRDSGVRWRELSARFDRDSSSWRTHRLLFDEVLPWCSVTLPRWGSMRDGVCWERSTPERRTSESGCGFWPTPRATDNDQGRAADDMTDVRSSWKTQGRGATLSTAVRLWPTPNCGGYRSDGELRLLANATDSPAEYEAMSHRACRSKRERWATPTVHGNYNRRGLSSKSGDGPATQVGGKLNPTWVEWLMGWPLDWTDCAASATDRFRQWCSSHGLD